MILHKTKIKDLILFENKKFFDKRGSFQEFYNSQIINKILKRKIKFVQDNISTSRKNVLRGIHYQINKPQGKLVSVLKGKVFDVAVDLRKKSKTFGNWEAFYLSGDDKKFLWIPEGFGHAFLSLQQGTQLFYKVNNFYDPKDQNTIIWNDISIGIKWKIKKNIILSEHDKNGIPLKLAKLF